MNLDDIIEYDDEGTKLDFKKEEYKKENYTALLKDVMSMANALNTECKRIIIGVKYTPGEEKNFCGLETIADQGTLENIIQENIEPNISFRYYSYTFKGTMLGVLEIFDNFNKPYMMKKDYGSGLKRGDAWIRKGSRQSRVIREDLDKMMEAKKTYAFENKVTFGFGKKLEKEITLSKTSIQNERFPSEVRKKELEGLLKKLNDRCSQNTTIHKADNSETPLQKTSLTLFSEFNDSDKRIRVGYNEFNLPVYRNKKELEEKINKVKEQYQEDDSWYLYEKNSHKINCYIYNDGAEFLEDVKIELFFDVDVFDISPEIYEEPSEGSALRISDDINSTNNYPNVHQEENMIVVEEEHKQVRHKTLTAAFFEELRVLVKPNTEIATSEVKYKISARNLAEHIEGSLFIRIV